MNWIGFVFQSRGVSNSFQRALDVFQRFGVHSSSFSKILRTFEHIQSYWNARPSFPIASILLERHPALRKELQSFDFEWLSHGYVHHDFSKQNYPVQKQWIQRSLDLLSTNCFGFRAPYLHWNQDTLLALKDTKMLYDSSCVYFWDFPDNDLTFKQKEAIKKVHQFYDPYRMKGKKSLPTFENNYLQIPVSLPDDEILLDRLRIQSEEQLLQIWKSLICQNHDRETLFTIQLHPERIPFFEKTLKNIHQILKELNPPVWKASLNQIATWWSKRNTFQWEITMDSIHWDHSPDIHMLISKNLDGSNFKSFYGSWYSIEGHSLKWKSLELPILAVENEGKKNIPFLKQWGYLFELKREDRLYSLDLNRELEESDLEFLLTKHPNPLLRIAHWPKPFQSAVCLSGDIDCVTLQDFLFRIWGR